MKGKKLFLLVPMVFLLVLFGWAGGAWARVAQISGDWHSVIIKDDGTLWGWGPDGTTVGNVKPERIGKDSDWKLVSAGEGHTAAIKTDGTLWAWGNNSYGQLGDGTVAHSTEPILIDANAWKVVSAGSEYTLGIKEDGTLWAWGRNYAGQLGDGTETNRCRPVQIGESMYRWKFIAAGEYHTLAVKEDGTLWGWGRNYAGQLGDGTKENKSSPVQVSTENWKIAVAAEDYSVGIKDDGTLWAWGSNQRGQLGDGTKIGRLQPTQIGSDSWKIVAAKYQHTLAIKEDGTLWAWGSNFFGQLGTTGSVTHDPVQVGEDRWKSVAAGHYHTLAVKEDETFWSWGYNGHGQLGNGTNGGLKLIPIQISTDSWESVAAGGAHSLAIKKEDQTIWAWGSNLFNQLGKGISGIGRKAIPVQLGLTLWNFVAAGNSHTVAIKEDKTLWVWGENGFGLIGTDADAWNNVAAGNRHTAAIKENGILWTWGQNVYGQLGDGTTSVRNSPMQIGTDAWEVVAAGYDHTLGIKENGTLWAWGRNQYGQLGDGTKIDRHIPIQVNGEIWTHVVAGRSYSVAIKDDGTIWAWGANHCGQLGDGTEADKYSPVQIGVDRWKSVAAGKPLDAGGFHTLAIKEDGTLWAWGSNWQGQLGDGTRIDRASPVQIGIDTWQAVSAGGFHTLAIKEDGTLWAWGYNYSGQLGDGTAWQENPVSINIPPTNWIVTPSAGEHGSIIPNTPQNVEDGSTVSFTVTPDEDYSIDKVEGCGGTLNGDKYTTGAITADCAVSASFKLKSYIVTPSVGANGSISPNSPQSVEHDKTADFTVTPDAGYLIETVEGCGGSLNGNVYTTGAITADCAVTATFVSSTTYTVTPRTGRHGSISPSAPQQVRQGTTASFTVTPDAEYAIRYMSGCGGSLSGNVYTTGPVTQDCSVTALFKRLPKHFVIPSAGRHGSISPRRVQRVLHGEATSFTVTPRPGYAVRNVSGCGGSLSGNIYTTGAIIRSCWVRAAFMKEEDAPMMSR